MKFLISEQLGTYLERRSKVFDVELSVNGGIFNALGISRPHFSNFTEWSTTRNFWVSRDYCFGCLYIKIYARYFWNSVGGFQYVTQKQKHWWSTCVSCVHVTIYEKHFVFKSILKHEKIQTLLKFYSSVYMNFLLKNSVQFLIRTRGLSFTISTNYTIKTFRIRLKVCQWIWTLKRQLPQ